APAPVDYFTVKDMGFDNYAAAMVVRADKIEALDACLRVLVPAMAQAWVDYLADPTPVTDALISVNETYDTYWQISADLNTRGIEILEEEGFGSNSPD
ncbi:MAG TPA: nitrate ABC transporter substrate-binding protein, partial [Acidimicrobiaceae bacterium]|nr:nitrate ABC transporter substrate-binding protein [Acidimicrobiaceae bacterium]